MRIYNLQSGRNYVVSMLTHICNNGIIIDFCGGEGYVARMITERLPMKNFKIISQDICDVLQQDGIKLINTNSIFFLTSDCLHSGFKNGVADAIILTESIEHIRDVSRFFNEAYRILKKGGWLYITTPNKTGFSFWFGERGIHYFLNFLRATTLRFSKMKHMGTYGFVDNEKGYERILAFNELKLEAKRAGFIVERHFANQFLGEIFFIICEKLKMPLCVCALITRLSIFIERLICNYSFVSKIFCFNQVLIARKL